MPGVERLWKVLKVIHPSGGVCRAHRFLTIKTFHTHTLLQCLWRNNLPRANKSHNAREERVVIHTSDGDTCMGYINPKCQTIAGCRHENQALFPAPSHPARDRKLSAFNEVTLSAACVPCGINGINAVHNGTAYSVHALSGDLSSG